MKDLGKWPRLLVSGDRVTNEQAGDILVRTASRHVLSNDRDWQRQARQILGLSADPYDNDDATWDALGNLRLRYLANHQITSTWIGGPKGWCDWQGWVFADYYNIGTNPTHDAITDDWFAIAKAFPYLKLRCQLLNDDETGEPAGTWDVFGGNVAFRDDVTELMMPPHEIGETRVLYSVLLGLGEGVDPERLAAAVERIRAGAASCATGEG